MATAEVTSQRVQRILASEFEVKLTKNGGFAVEYESTVTFIEVKDWGTDDDKNPRSIVRIWAPLGREVKPSPELYRWAAIDGRAMLFGGVTVLEAEDGKQCLVMFDTTLLGDYIDPAELITAVSAITVTANELDDIVRDRFGGKRYTDPS